MKTSRLILSALIISIICLLAGCQSSSEADRGEKNMASDNFIFVTYIESPQQLDNVFRLTESIRTFGGRFSKSPVWAYHPDDVIIDDEEKIEKLHALGVEIRASHTPENAKWYFYSGKVYAAASAEKAAAEAEGNPILIYTDSDAIVLLEPDDLSLETGKSLAYRPVMHNRAGSLYDQPVDPFWARIFELGNVTEDMLFPMITHADRQKVRAYFHCGILSLRPEKGILRKWADDFDLMIVDSAIMAMCEKDIVKRVFLHQNALTGAVLNTISRKETRELSDSYNYPIFFEKQYDALEPFNSIQDVVTIRCIVLPENMGPEWYNELKGPQDRIDWLKQRIK